MGCANSGGNQQPSDPTKGSSSKGGKSASKPSAREKTEEKGGGIGHGKFIMDSSGKILDTYEMEKKKLGEGSYGSVCKAKHKSTKQVVAVKTISKSQMKNIERFKQEIAIMKMMDHWNIIKLYETYEDHRNIYLVMELCVGGELFDRIIEAGHFQESQAAVLMQQIIGAIFYMHNAKICHRDLKPENFLFTTKESIEKSTLKIIDFGLSCKFEAGQTLTTKAGTPYYVAPQVLAGKYDQLSDLWSVGVIMYVMLCGYPPFFGETDAEVLSKVRLGNFSFNAADWKNVSEDAKNLIRMLLKMNPKDRFTAEQALTHTWIKNKAPQAKSISLQEGFADKLKTFRTKNKFKKAALHVIATKVDEKSINNMRKVFQSFDKNHDGTLTLIELKAGLEATGMTELLPELNKIVADIDSDGSGVIDYTEFLAATLEKAVYIKEDVCWTAFRVFDTNGDGKISREELSKVLGDENVQEAVTKEVIENVMKSSDGNNDGFIDFQEFMMMMKNQGEGEAEGGNEAAET